MSKNLLLFTLLLTPFACISDGGDPSETGDSPTTFVGSTTAEGETEESETFGGDCATYDTCINDAVDALAACGAGDGPCTDPEFDGCERMACLSGCRLEAAVGAQSCDEAFAECAGEGSSEACFVACYQDGTECLQNGAACDTFLEGCSEAQGACVSECTQG